MKKFKKLKDILNYKSLYWVFMIVAGFCFTFFIPLFQKPDEGYHYNQVLSFIGGVRNFPNFNLPTKIYIGEYGIQGTSFSGLIMGDPNYKFPLSLYKNDFLILKNKEVIKTNLTFKIDTVFSYFPQILGYSLNFGYPVLGFYLGRTFAFLFFLICIYFSYKTIKKEYRSILIIYCCLPMVWQQVTSYSYDAVFLSLCPLILSLLTKYFSDIRLRLKDVILFSSLLILLSLVKPGNELFLFLVLLFPFEKLSLSFSKLKLFLIRIILFLVIIFAFSKKNLVSVSVSTNINYNQLIQKNMLFNDIGYVIGVGLNSLKVKSDFYINSFLGNFGWLDYHLENWVYFFIVVLLLIIYFSMLDKLKKSILNYKQIVGLFIIIFIYIGIIFGSMYAGWTSAVARVIEGVQGRYFLPIVPFFLFGISELILKIGKERSKKVYIGFSIIVIFISFTSATFKRYYDYSLLYQNEMELGDRYNSYNDKHKLLETILLNKKIEISIPLKNDKFSGFQLITKLPKEGIVIPYAYSIFDEKNNLIQKGYLPITDMIDGGVYEENFKIKEVKSEKVIIKIWPLIIDEKENYISIYKNLEDNSFFINLLYIRK